MTPRRPFGLGVLVGLVAAFIFAGGWPSLPILRAQVPFGAVRLMDGAHTQLARVDHVGSLAVTCMTAAGVAESCGGTGGSGDAVNVFHQSTVRHISSVTHIAGGISVVSQAGTYVTVTGTALDVNCTGCSAASVVNVAHISAQVHVRLIPSTNFNDIIAVHIVGRNCTTCSALVSHAGAVLTDAQQTGTWTVQPGNTPNTTAWLVNVQHVSSQLHINLAGVGGIPIPTSQGLPIQHVSGVVHVNIVSSRHLTGAIHVAGISNVGSGAINTGTTAMVCHSTLAVHVAAAAPGYTQLIHLTSTNGGVDQTAWRIYICGIVLISAHAQGMALLEGVGTTCLTGRLPVMGSWRPDDSMVTAANGGFSSVAPFPWLSTQNPGNNLCIAQTTRTAGGTISGTITYRAGP